MTIASTIATGGFIAYRYKVAGPSEYIVRTGLGIKDISITKKAIHWPFQKYSILTIKPHTFPIEVDAMSAQRIPFRMPSVWTIGPKNELASLENYARLLFKTGMPLFDGIKEQTGYDFLKSLHIKNENDEENHGLKPALIIKKPSQ